MAEKPSDKVALKIRKKLTAMKQEVIKRQYDERTQISGTERMQDGFDTPFGDGSANDHVSRINSDKDQIRAIELAIRMIDQGTYGICQDCNNPIPLSRLEAAPFSTLCITCKEAREKKGPSHRRKK